MGTVVSTKSQIALKAQNPSVIRELKANSNLGVDLITIPTIKQNMKHTLNYLQRYRKAKGLTVKEMARIIGMDGSNLSKVELGNYSVSLEVLIAYHVILNLPIEKLIKKHFPEIIKECLRNALAYKDELLEQLESPAIPDNIIRLDTIIDQLVEADSNYE